MEPEIKREIILEHNSNPINKKIPKDSEYIKINSNNPSCIDNIDIYLKIEDNKIIDICFDGEACAISTASTSIMIANLIGKDIDEALEYIKNFNNMIEEKEYNKEILKEALAFDEIYKQQNRITCARLPYVGIKKALEENKDI